MAQFPQSKPAPKRYSFSGNAARRAAFCCGSLALLGGCQSAPPQSPLPTPLPFVSRSPSDNLANKLATSKAEKSSQVELANSSTSPESSGDSLELTSLNADRKTDGQDPDFIAPLPPSEFPSAAIEQLRPVEDASLAISLETLEQIALQNNPSIAQASSSAHKASGFRRQVGIFPNPTVGYSGQQLDDKGTDQHLAFVEQEFVTANKLRLNEMVLDQEVQSQLWEVEAQRYRVLTDLKIRFYQTLAAQRRAELAKEFMEVAQEGVRIAELRREALEGSIPEVLQAEIQLSEVEIILQRAEITNRKTWKEMVAVAGVGEMTQRPLLGNLRVESPPYDWEATYQNLAQQNPALIAARARVSMAIANMNRQDVQAIPNLLTSLQAGYDNGTGSQMLNLDVGIPLPIFNRNQGNISAAQAEFCRATQEVRRLELSLKQRLAEASRQYESAVVTVDRLETNILPKARKTLELSEKSYSAGEFSFLQVLIVRRTFFDSNLQYNAALQELAESKSLIEGMLLTGALDDTRDTTMDASLREQALSGQ